MSRNHGSAAPRVRNVVGVMALAGIGLVGCSRGYTEVHVVHTSRPPAVVHEPRVVVVEKGHHHTSRCGHYCHNGNWYYAPGHVHGKHCGHKKKHGDWVLVDK